MKKALIALLAMGSMAGAATTIVEDLTQDFSDATANLVWTASTHQLTGSGISAIGGGSQPHTGISFTLNLTKAMAVTGDTNLIVFDMNNTDTGIALTTTGIRGIWGASVWSGSATATWETLSALNSVFTGLDGNKYITLTLTAAQPQGDGGGTQLYSSDASTKLMNDGSLGTSKNTTMSAVTLNTDYIVMAAVTPGWVSPTNAPGVTATLNTKAVEILTTPEPATATLSLLALAGLAARRRRH